MTRLQRERLLDTRREGSRIPGDPWGKGEILHFNGGIFSSWKKQGGGRRLGMLPFPVVNAALGDKKIFALEKCES